MRRELLISSLTLLVLVITASARTWYVNAEGTGDAPTIQAGIDSSAAADTVLLADGTYTGEGNRDIECGKAVTVSSESRDPEVCVIDCQGAYSVYHRGFGFHGVGTGQCVLDGITIQGGYEYNGGAVQCDTCLSLRITHCVFTQNQAESKGGALYTSGASLLIEDSDFLENSLGYLSDTVGGAICSEGSNITIQRCGFVGNSSQEFAGGAISTLWSELSIFDALFIGNYTGSEDYPHGLGGAIHCCCGTLNLTRVVMGDNSAFRGGSIIVAAGASATLTQVTVYGSQGHCALYCAGSSLTLDRTIISFSSGHPSPPYGQAIDCDSDCTPALSCCNIHGNAGGDWVGCIADQYGVNGNFSACPSFCFAGQGDFHLCDQSPCLPGYHPYGHECGLIGAYDQGCVCDPTRTKPTSWGGIKSLYR